MKQKGFQSAVVDSDSAIANVITLNVIYESVFLCISVNRKYISHLMTLCTSFNCGFVPDIHKYLWIPKSCSDCNSPQNIFTDTTICTLVVLLWGLFYGLIAESIGKLQIRLIAGLVYHVGLKICVQRWPDEKKHAQNNAELFY